MYLEQVEKIQLLIERSKNHLALDMIQDSLSIDPGNDFLYALRAEALLELEDHKNATKAVKEAISINPEEDYYLSLHARIEIDQYNNKKCLKLINAAIELNPLEPTYFGLKAAALYDLNRVPEAFKAAKTGLSLDPQDELCRLSLFMILGRKGETELVKGLISERLEEDPANAFTQAVLGITYLREGKYGKAKELFSLSLQMEPDNGLAKLGMLESLKASHLLYALNFKLALWMESQGLYGNWVFIAGILVVVGIAPKLTPIYLAFLLWLWFTRPIGNMLMYFYKYGRYLMPYTQILATQINLGMFGIAMMSFVLGYLFGGGFFLLGCGCMLTIIPVFELEESGTDIRYWIQLTFASFFLLCGIGASVTGMVSAEVPSEYELSLLLGALTYSWLN